MGPCHTSLHLPALAPGCSSHQVQDTDACIWNSHRLSTLLLPLTYNNLHPLKKSEICEWASPRGAITERHKITLQIVFIQIKLRWALYVTYTIIQSIMRSEMCSLHLTHPSAHTWSSGQPTVQRPGSSRGLPAGAGIRTHNFGLPRVSSPTRYPRRRQLCLLHRSWLVEWTSHPHPDCWIPDNFQVTP